MTGSNSAMGARTEAESRDDESDADARCLADLRAELAASYPAVSAGALVRIARRHGLDVFPPGFLLDGLLTDRSASGPRAKLRRLNSALSGSVHPLFSAEFYALSNPDVAESGVSPWMHYQVFGRLESRSPHPLIDPTMVAAALPGVNRAHALDRYLYDRAFWFNDPGPYVDVRNFVLRGGWDGVQHPLIDLTTQLDGPWVHRRLLLVDSATTSQRHARLVGAGYLLTRNGGRSRLGRLAAWSGADGAIAREWGGGRFVVAPGFFVGRGEQELIRMSHSVVSADNTLVRLPDETLGLLSGDSFDTSLLMVITRPIGRSQLEQSLREHPTAVFAPYDRAQEISLRQLRRDHGFSSSAVLAVGAQAHVTAESALAISEEPPAVLPSWDWSSNVDPREVAVVLHVGSRKRTTGDPPLRSLLARGASLCLIDGAGLNTWLPILQARDHVVVAPELVAAVAAFVEESRLSILPERGPQS